LIQNGFQGLGTINSDMSDEYIETIWRYIELYEKILVKNSKADISNIMNELKKRFGLFRGR
jgi:transcription-repair coupling factor (superfamily II helicase)